MRASLAILPTSSGCPMQVVFDAGCAVQAAAGATVSPGDLQVRFPGAPSQNVHRSGAVRSACAHCAAWACARAPALGCCRRLARSRLKPLEPSGLWMRQVWATAFNDRDTTFGNGINISGVNYEVHRFYEDDGVRPAPLLAAVRHNTPTTWTVKLAHAQDERAARCLHRRPELTSVHASLLSRLCWRPPYGRD